MMIMAGVSLALVCCFGETYAPSIIHRKTWVRRKETGDERWWTRYEERKPFLTFLQENLRRPLEMAVTEPILIIWDIYASLVYGIIYLCYVAYPLVFQAGRGWSPGITGLSYAGIGIGAVFCIALEPIIRKYIKKLKVDPATGKPAPEAMVAPVCIAAILIPAGELWFAWTCTPDYHRALPIAAGIPFGLGSSAVFIYVSTYLAHSYGRYAASAMAGNAVLRSIFGAVLPFAGASMYHTLGPVWAGTLLGLLELACLPIPFVFYFYGDRIRERSALIRSVHEEAKVGRV